MPSRSVEEHVASLTVKMLRARLKKEGRSTKGLKDQLADRLLATLQTASRSAPICRWSSHTPIPTPDFVRAI